MMNAKSILVPTDFSKYSYKALDLAVDVAKHNNAKIQLLHVVDIIQQCAADYCLPSADVVSLRGQIKKTSDANLKKMIDKFKKEGIAILGDVKEGVPYEEIMKAQKAKKADLIIMSAHGRTGLKKYLIGSVTDKVIKGSPCNVVVVKS
jgi:nucleotide-binding universal stress UspA family protein